jgi:hypothetical protein
MLVKNTFQTLFRVGETGLELVGDFVSRTEAEEYAKQEGILSYTIMETVVQHEVKITTIVTPARAIRIPRGQEFAPGGPSAEENEPGKVDPTDPGLDPAAPRELNKPITGVRPGQSHSPKK